MTLTMIQTVPGLPWHMRGFQRPWVMLRGGFRGPGWRLRGVSEVIGDVKGGFQGPSVAFRGI